MQELGREAEPEEMPTKETQSARRPCVRFSRWPSNPSRSKRFGDVSVGDFIKDKKQPIHPDVTSYSLLKDTLSDVLANFDRAGAKNRGDALRCWWTVISRRDTGRARQPHPRAHPAVKRLCARCGTPTYSAPLARFPRRRARKRFRGGPRTGQSSAARLNGSWRKPGKRTLTIGLRSPQASSILIFCHKRANCISRFSFCSANSFDHPNLPRLCFGKSARFRKVGCEFNSREFFANMSVRILRSRC